MLPPTTELSVVATEFPQSAVDKTEQGIALTLSEPARVSFLVADGGSQIPSSILLTRPSLIPGRPRVVVAAETDEYGSATLQLLPVEYAVRVTPLPPNDATYPPLVTTVRVLRSSTIALPLTPLAALIQVTGVVCEFCTVPRCACAAFVKAAAKPALERRSEDRPLSYARARPLPLS